MLKYMRDKLDLEVISVEIQYRWHAAPTKGRGLNTTAWQMLTSFQMLWGQLVGHPTERAQTRVCAMLVQVPEESCFPESWHNHRSICLSSSQSWTHSHHIQMTSHLPWQHSQYHHNYIIYKTYHIYLCNLYTTLPKNSCYIADWYFVSLNSI
jgi:hypothetical protein